MPAARPNVPALPDHCYLVDTHCHLDMDDYRDDCHVVVQRAIANGVAGIISVGIDLASSAAAISIAQQNMSVRATVGIHPHNAEHIDDQMLDALIDLVKRNRNEIVGFGEIGLDYAKCYAEPKKQRALFIKQLGIAKELGLPIIIHDRDAHGDCLDILLAQGPFNQGGVMHCFSGDLALAGKIIDNNLHISIPGIVTFKNAHMLHEVAAHLPLEWMLVETDGPFLAPIPFRGKRNEPLYTLYTAAAIATLRNCPIGDIATQTSQNACRLFGHDFFCRTKVHS